MDKSFYDDCKTDPEFFDVIEKHGFDRKGNIKFRVKRVQYAVITYTKEQIQQDREEKTGVGDFINSCETYSPEWEWETDSGSTRIQFVD